MSLIVARKITCPEISIVIIGDTRLSSDAEYSPVLIGDTWLSYISPDKGIIKTSIIHDNLSISFAGDSSLADQFFKKNTQFFLQQKKEEVLDKIHQFDSDDKVDFIVCFGSSDGQDGEIVSIKNGKIERNCSFACIGTQKAYNEFNRKYFNYINDYEKTYNVTVPGIIKKCAMLQSMREVIEEQKEVTVGDFCYEVFYLLNNRKFMYQSGFIICVNQPKKNFSVGTAADGDYSIYSGADPNNQYYALYLYQIQQVWIWGAPDGGCMKVIRKISDTSLIECENILKNDYQIMMKLDVFGEFKNK